MRIHNRLVLRVAYISLPQAMMTFLDGAYNKFKRPLWLTEFNCGDGAPDYNPYANQTAANHLRFMKAALPKLEAAKHVQRWVAWPAGYPIILCAEC